MHFWDSNCTPAYVALNISHSSKILIQVFICKHTLWLSLFCEHMPNCISVKDAVRFNRYTVSALVLTRHVRRCFSMLNMRFACFLQVFKWWIVASLAQLTKLSETYPVQPDCDWCAGNRLSDCSWQDEGCFLLCCFDNWFRQCRSFTLGHN